MPLACLRMCDLYVLLPASTAKKPSSGDQVLALKRDEKKGRKKKPMLTGQKLHLIRENADLLKRRTKLFLENAWSMDETQLKQKQQELAQHQQKMHEAEQRLTEEQETMLGLQVKPQMPTDHHLFGVFIAIFGGLLFWWKLSKRKVGCPCVGASSSLPSSHVS